MLYRLGKGSDLRFRGFLSTPPLMIPAVVQVIAHRGARRRAPENTVLAFREALRLGADGVELDVRRSADDQLVVHHDATLPGVGAIVDHPLAVLRQARPDLAVLDEALDACAGKLVNIELKCLPGDPDFDSSGRLDVLVVGVLQARERRDDVLVSSFNLDAVDRVHALDETIPTALLTLSGFDPLLALQIVHERGHAGWHPQWTALAGTALGSAVERADELGVRVSAWTVNEPEDMRRLARGGVHGVITDVPDIARQVLDA